MNQIGHHKDYSASWIPRLCASIFAEDCLGKGEYDISMASSLRTRLSQLAACGEVLLIRLDLPRESEWHDIGKVLMHCRCHGECNQQLIVPRGPHSHPDFVPRIPVLAEGVLVRFLPHHDLQYQPLLAIFRPVCTALHNISILHFDHFATNTCVAFSGDDRHETKQQEHDHVFDVAAVEAPWGERRPRQTDE